MLILCLLERRILMSIDALKINKINYISKYAIKRIPSVEQENIVIDIDNLQIDSMYKPYLREFINKTSNFNFRNINQTLETLSITNIKFPETLLKNNEGEYSISENKIRIRKDNIDSLYHELFHAFTSWREDSSIGCGFYQEDLGYNIGSSLDEGYTDLLFKDIFNNEINYTVEANIANKLQLILTKEKMQEMYTSNNLIDIVEFLSQYSSKQESVSFIILMDKLDKYNYENKKTIRLMNILSNYLVDVYVNALSFDYQVGVITYADIYDKLDIFKEEFVKYAFDDKKIEKNYLRSSDYLDITSKLSNDYFQKQLAIRKTYY